MLICINVGIFGTVHQGSIVMKDARGLTQLAEAEPAAEEKREV